MNITPAQSLAPRRRVPSATEIHQMVDDRLAKLVPANTTFTAYDVTKALRIGYPDLEIVHDPDVRERVHFAMSLTFGYWSEDRDYTQADGSVKAALTYFPAPTKPATNVTVTKAPVHQLPGMIIVIDDDN